MSVNASTPLLSNNPLKTLQDVSSLPNKIDNCYFSCKIKVTKLGITSLYISGAAATIVGLTSIVFAPTSIALASVCTATGIVSCFGAGCLYWNRPSKVQLIDPEAYRNFIVKNNQIAESSENIHDNVTKIATDVDVVREGMSSLQPQMENLVENMKDSNQQQARIVDGLEHFLEQISSSSDDEKQLEQN